MTDAKFFPNPLDSIPDEIVLGSPPLTAVTAQVRFDPILEIIQPNSAYVASFQEAIRGKYPVYKANSERLSHAFEAPDGSEVMLNREYLLLATTKYGGRAEFGERFREVLDTAKNTLKIRQTAGTGALFTNQLVSKDVLDNLGKYVNPKFLSPFSEALETEMLIHLKLPNENAFLTIRWGKLAPYQRMPNVYMSDYADFSWVLSSDIGAPNVMPFEPDKITEVINGYLARAYAMFRHVFNDDFIRLCKGEKNVK